MAVALDAAWAVGLRLGSARVRAARGRVLSERDALAEVAARRAKGERVVLTNGAFDLLHVGHVRMLAEAAALGDVLVVAVNDDDAVAAAKGAGRPVVPAAERAELVAALPGVDLVVVVPDRTMHGVLERFRPHVHAKGRDYDAASHPEAEANRALGVEMAFVGDEKGHGSRDLVARAAGAPPPSCDRIVEWTDAQGARGLASADALPFLRAHGLADLASILDDARGVEVARHGARRVRRIAFAGRAVFVKVEIAAKRGRIHADPVEEARNHWAMRAAGFRAAEPLVALAGKTQDGRRAGALVTAEEKGPGLDAFLRERLAGAGAAKASAWAEGVGRALRAWHTARFLPPDLHAWHLVVDGSPTGAARSLALLDLARLERPGGRVLPADAAVGLAALALTLRPVTTARFRLRILRGYLAGDLREARRWLEAIAKRIRHVEKRGTFRRVAEGVR